jgi:tRNA(Phe) wybutosine-synthesizing methylase Tyw3
MFIFNTQKLYSFIQNYIRIIARILLKCKSYILHIKTSQIEKTRHLYERSIYVFHAIFTL